MSVTGDVLAKVREKNPAEPEFIQAVEEVMSSLELTEKKNPEFVKAKIYERIVEPDRIIIFRVPWVALFSYGILFKMSVLLSINKCKILLRPVEVLGFVEALL